MSLDRYGGGYELVKVERDALEQQRRNLQVERREFQRQVKIVQDQVARQKRELNTGQTALQHEQQVLRTQRLTLEIAQQDLANAQHEVEQQRRENTALREDLHRQQETLLRAQEEMVRKETARRLRRTPSEGFLEDAYSSLGTVDILKLLGNASARIRRQAARSLIDCASSGSDGREPTIEHSSLRELFLPTIVPIIAETSFPDVKEFASTLLKNPSFAVALVRAGQIPQLIALLKGSQPVDLSEAAMTCLSSVLSRRDPFLILSSKAILRELATELEDIQTRAGLRFVRSTAEAAVKELLEAKNYDAVTKYMLHGVLEIRQAVSQHLDVAITEAGSHSAGIIAEGMFLSRLCSRFLLPPPFGREQGDAPVPSDIVVLVTKFLPRLCRPLCSTDVATTSLMVKLIFSKGAYPSDRAVAEAVIGAVIKAASADASREVWQSLVNAGLLETIALALSPSSGGVGAMNESVFRFCCQIIPFLAVVAAATDPSHVSSLLGLLMVKEPEGRHDLLNSLIHSFRLIVAAEGQTARNLVSLLEPNLLGPPAQWNLALSAILPSLFELRGKAEAGGDGFNWDSPYVLNLLRHSSSSGVRRYAGNAMLTRCRTTPNIIISLCQRGYHPQILELCTSSQYEETKRIGCELLRIPGMGAQISVSSGTTIHSRSLDSTEVNGSADLIALISHPDMPVRISSYVALLDAARAGDGCRTRLARAGLAPALKDVTLVHHTGETQSTQFILDMLDALFFVWIEGEGHPSDVEVVVDMLASDHEQVAAKAFYLTRQSFSGDLSSRQNLRVTILSRVLSIGEKPSPILAYAAISVAECYAFDLLKIREFGTVFGLLQHPEPRIRNAMTLSMAKALRENQGIKSEDPELCEGLIRAGFFQLLLHLLERHEPTNEIIDFSVRCAGLELISLTVARHGGLPEMWRLVESHPKTSVRAAATKGIGGIASTASENDRTLLTGGKPLAGMGDASKERFYLVSSISRIVGNTSHVEPHIESLCQASFSKFALQAANSDDMPQLVAFLDHTNENISKAAATALDAILSSDSTTREPLRKHLLANLSKAPPGQYSFTVKAVAQILALDIVTMHDFPTVFAALHYPPEIQAPILEYTLHTVVNDPACRRGMIEAGFVNIFEQALSVGPQLKEEVREFLTRCVEAAAIEIGRSGHTSDILRVCSHKDQSTSVTILLGLGSIVVNGTEEDRVCLIHDGFLDELLHLSNRDSLAPGVIKLLQQSVPGMSDAILRESKVTVFLLSLLCNKHAPVVELSRSALHYLLSNGDTSSDMLRAQLWSAIPNAPTILCEFITQALRTRWADDLSTDLGFPRLYELLPHPYLGIRLEAMKQLTTVATSADVQITLVDTGVFEVLLTLIGDPRDDVRTSSNNLLPVLGIAFARGGKLRLLQNLLFSSDKRISSSSYYAIRSILDTGNEKDNEKLVESGLVPDLLSGTAMKSSKNLSTLLDISLTKLAPLLLLNGSGSILFDVLEMCVDVGLPANPVIDHVLRRNHAPMWQATSEAALKELANTSGSDYRNLVWNLLFPRLKSPSERLRTVGSAMLACRLAADRVDAGEYSFLYELLGHPHAIIRRPIIEEFSRLMHAENANAQRNGFSVDLLNTLLHLTADPAKLPDIVSFTGNVFLPKAALTLCHLGKTTTVVATLEHRHPQLRRGSCLALEAIALSPEKHMLLSAGILLPCCNMKRLRGDADLTRLVRRLVPNIIEFVKKWEDLKLLFRLFSHPDETVTSMISESLSQMMQNKDQDFILLDFVLDRLPVQEGSEGVFISKAIRGMGVAGTFYRAGRTSVLLEFLASDVRYISHSAREAVIQLAQEGDLALKQNLVDSRIMSYLEGLNLSASHRQAGLEMSTSILPHLCSLSMASGHGREIINMFLDPHEPLGRIIDAEWQVLARTQQGVSIIVAENVIPLVLKSIGRTVGHSAIPVVCSLSRRCGANLLMRKQGEIFLDMMESQDHQLTGTSILNLLALSEGSEEYSEMIFNVPRICERLASALDSLHDSGVTVDILHIVQNLVRGSSVRSEGCLSSPISTSVYRHSRSSVRSVRLTSLNILFNIFLSVADKTSMMDENLINTLRATLTSQDADICAVTLGIIAEACRYGPCREIVARKQFIELILVWARPEQDTACRRLAWEAITNIASGTDEDRLQLVNSGVINDLAPLIRHHSSDVAKFAIEVVGLIGKSGAFYQNVVDSGAVKKLDHVKSLIYKTKLANNEDKKGTREAALQALKRISSAKRLSRSPSIRNRNDAPLVNRASIRIGPLREDVEPL